MLIAALFITAKKSRKTQSPWVDEGMRYIFSNIQGKKGILINKKNEVLTHSTILVNLENITLMKDKTGHILYFSIYIKCPE